MRRLGAALLWALTAVLSLAASVDVEPVVLRWRARGEQQVYGYLVYRATAREGPYLRVSEDIVHVGEGGGEHAYEFTDSSLEPCTTYYYYLDQVYRSGQRERFSGVVSKRTRCAEDG